MRYQLLTAALCNLAVASTAFPGIPPSGSWSLSGGLNGGTFSEYKPFVEGRSVVDQQSCALVQKPLEVAFQDCRTYAKKAERIALTAPSPLLHNFFGKSDDATRQKIASVFRAVELECSTMDRGYMKVFCNVELCYSTEITHMVAYNDITKTTFVRYCPLLFSSFDTRSRGAECEHRDWPLIGTTVMYNAMFTPQVFDPMDWNMGKWADYINFAVGSCDFEDPL